MQKTIVGQLQDLGFTFREIVGIWTKNVADIQLSARVFDNERVSVSAGSVLEKVPSVKSSGLCAYNCTWHVTILLLHAEEDETRREALLAEEARLAEVLKGLRWYGEEK